MLQDPNNQPESSLLREIETEKQRLVKEEKFKEAKPLPAIKSEEILGDTLEQQIYTATTKQTELVNAVMAEFHP